MIARLLEWLVCPSCRDKLTLEVSSLEGEKIIEGALNCPCGKRFPIIGGVPIMLCDDLSSKKKPTAVGGRLMVVALR